MLRSGMVRALAAATALVAAPLACACTPQEPQAGGTSVAAEFAAVKADYDKAMKAFQTAYRAAKTDEEREKIFQDQYPKADPYADRALAIAKKAPKDPAAAECLVWALEQDGGAHADEVLTMLLADHLDSEKLRDACRNLEYRRVGGAEQFLRTVKAKSPHHAVQGQACYTLGKFLATRADQARRLQSGDEPDLAARYEKFYGKAWVDALRATDAAAAAKEAESCLEEVVARCGDVKGFRKTLADQAKGDLFELRNLVVGKPAPEIEGEDLDGQKFKLSDYRGKVVFLDFWGFW